MPVDAFRVQNFMGFVDSGWIEMRPLTLLFGRNSSGKSAILRALLLLQQSLDGSSRFGPLLFVDAEGLDFGSYREMVYNHEMDRKIIFTFRHRFTDYNLSTFYHDNPDVGFIPIHQQEPTTASYALLDTLTKLVDPEWAELESPHIYVQSELSFRAGVQPGQAEFCGLTLRYGEEHPNDTVSKKESERIIELTKLSPSRASINSVRNQWKLASDYLLPEDIKATEWEYLVITNVAGFFPRFQIADRYFDPTQQELVPDEDTRNPLDFSGMVGSFLQLVSILSPEIRSFLNLTYLGPLRPEPLRYYYATGQSRANRIRNRVIQAVIEAKQIGNPHSELAERFRRIQGWLEDTLKTTFDIRPIEPSGDGIVSDKNLYEIVFQEVSSKDDSVVKGVTASIREVGSGLSQVLPVLIEALFAPKGTTVIIEQPELHLHPKAQAELSDIFIFAAKLGLSFILETHSENLLLRFRRCIAETTAKIPTSSGEPLTLDEFSALFVDRNKSMSTVSKIPFDQWGDYIIRPPGFGDFFGQDFEELTKMKRARMRRSS